MKQLPKAKNSKILIQEIGNEVLIYDLSTNKVYNLNETATLVWHNCDGKNSLNTISKNTKFPINLVLFTIDELQKFNLFEEPFETNLPIDRKNRRKLLLQFAATAFVLPLIMTIVAPQPINAQSGLVCKRNNGCDCIGGTQKTPLDTLGVICDVPSPDCDPECICTITGFIPQLPPSTPIKIQTCV